MSVSRPSHGQLAGHRLENRRDRDQRRRGRPAARIPATCEPGGVAMAAGGAAAAGDWGR